MLCYFRHDYTLKLEVPLFELQYCRLKRYQNSFVDGIVCEVLVETIDIRR